MPDIGSVPPDAELVRWLQEKIDEATYQAKNLSDEYFEVVQLCVDDQEPPEFAYARLLNRLRELKEVDLIRILSAFMWHGLKLQQGEK